MAYRVSKEARLDLDEVFIYWGNRLGLAVAEKIIDEIEDHFWLVNEFPDAGKSVEHRAPGMRCIPAGRYLIYYRKTKKGSEVHRIIHSARNQRSALHNKKHE